MPPRDNSTARRIDYPDSKPCAVCGKIMTPAMTEGKRSRLAKRATCSPECKRIYQAGPGNPRWRGGPVEIACVRCGAKKLVGRTITDIVKYCSRKCLSEANADRFRGELSPRWKGGQRETKLRYRERHKPVAPKSDEPIPKGRRPAGSKESKPKQAKPRGSRTRRERICPACGLPGVKKSCTYHFECSPLRQRKGRSLAKCIDCGKEKMVYPRFGVIQQRCLDCNTKRYKGEGNPRWRGGITPKNQKLRASEEYKTWRTAVFERDSYTCIKCGQVGLTLHAHHIKPFSTHPELRFEVSNGETLCVECHKKTDSYLSKAKKKRQKFRQLQFFA